MRGLIAAGGNRRVDRQRAMRLQCDVMHANAIRWCADGAEHSQTDEGVDVDTAVYRADIAEAKWLVVEEYQIASGLVDADQVVCAGKLQAVGGATIKLREV